MERPNPDKPIVWGKVSPSREKELYSSLGKLKSEIGDAILKFTIIDTELRKHSIGKEESI